MYSVTPALSFTGEVFGMHATAVNPPATAAAVPVATVSLCSCPGSRRWTCMSMRPGATTTPHGLAPPSTPPGCAAQQVQPPHPQGHAVGDLLENHGVRTIGDIRGDLHAAVHRSRVHDDHVRPGARHTLAPQSQRA